MTERCKSCGGELKRTRLETTVHRGDTFRYRYNLTCEKCGEVRPDESSKFYVKPMDAKSYDGGHMMSQTVAKEGKLPQLAAALCLQAIDDLSHPDISIALDALFFLASPDFPIWARAGGLRDANIFNFLVGKAHTMIETNDFNLLEAFRGLNEEQAEALTQKLLECVIEIVRQERQKLLSNNTHA